MREQSKSLLSDTRGLTTVEYIILLALVAVVGFTAWQNFGQTIVRKVGMSESAIASIDLGGGASIGAGGDVSIGSGVAAVTGAGPGGGPAGDGPAAGDADGGDADPGSDIWTEGGALGRGDSSGAGAIARGVVDGAVDVVSGTVDGVVGLATGLWDAVTNPRETAAAVAHAVTNPRETARAAYDSAASIVTSTIDAGSAMIDACTSGDGYACSRGVTNVAAAIIPVGAAGSAARGAAAVRRGTKGTDRVRAVTTDDRFGDFSDNRLDPLYRDQTRGTKIEDWYQRTEPAGADHILVGPQTIVPGRAINVSTDRVAVASNTGRSYEIAGHAGRDSPTLNGHATADVARQVVRDGGYRGGDIVLRACHSACSPLPQSLRRDLDHELARQGHSGRVGTIAAPTDVINSTSHHKNGGRWFLFRDSDPLSHID